MIRRIIFCASSNRIKYLMTIYYVTFEPRRTAE